MKNANNSEIKLFSPNKIKIKVNLKIPDKLVINQNFHKYWKTKDGELENFKGLLAVNLRKSGNYTVELKYVPIDFYIGLAISISTFLALLICWMRVDKNENNVCS